MSFRVPPRDGVRGGRDQFKWDDVKADKHRENYLGHSVMAPVGRWQNGRDLSWYSKSVKSDNNNNKSGSLQKSNEQYSILIPSREEIAIVKAAENEAMLIALGLKKQDAPLCANQKTNDALERLMATMEEEEQGDINAPQSGERIEGLGWKSTRTIIPTRQHETLPGSIENIVSNIKISEKLPSIEKKNNSQLNYSEVNFSQFKENKNNLKQRNSFNNQELLNENSRNFSKENQNLQSKRHSRSRSRSRGRASSRKQAFESSQRSYRRRRRRDSSTSRLRSQRLRSRSRSIIRRKYSRDRYHKSDRISSHNNNSSRSTRSPN